MADGTLYDTDFVAWTEQQSRLLRTHEHTNQPLDWEHLAEEIEDLGNSELAALSSQVRRVIQYLLKLQFCPAQEPRRSWIESIGDARGEIDDRLGHSRSLRPRLAAILTAQRPKATEQAARALEVYGEHKAAVAVKLHGGAYTDEQILGDWYPGEGDDHG